MNIYSNFHTVRRRLSRRLAGFRPVGLAFTLFALANIIIYLLIFLHPPLLEGLLLSADRPWGILTSAFTHADLGHLVNNLEGFVLAIGLFVVVSAVNPVRVRQRWSRTFLWLVFVAGFAANAVEYPLLLIGPNFNSWGASGVVYGAFGVLLAASLRNLPAHVRAISQEHRRWVDKRRKWGMFKFDRRSLAILPALVCIAVATTFLLLIFTNTSGFLSAGPGVDVWAHGGGFLFGFLGAMALFTFRFRRPSKSRN